jgi:prolyl oligopeptidase
MSYLPDHIYIYSYSPLHNLALPAEGQWPAQLLMTGDHDDRVVPAHTLKYAAKLYHLLRTEDVKRGQKNPVLVRVETDAGHGGGKPLDKTVRI